MNKSNDELIHRVQMARRQHDRDAVPSRHNGAYWIEARAKGSPAPTLRAGFWMISTTLSQVDELWAQVKAATEAGSLGYKARVATASRDDDPNHRMVHVMTYDYADVADVTRIRATLDRLYIHDVIAYHADEL